MPSSPGPSTSAVRLWTASRKSSPSNGACRSSGIKTPPPSPLPEAERGSQTTRCSSPPLRCGEGVGGRGFLPSRSCPSPNPPTCHNQTGTAIFARPPPPQATLSARRGSATSSQLLAPAASISVTAGGKSGMRNFLRALRCAWPYRVRLTLSVLCAIFAAIFWGLNFTAIYPVLKIIGSEQNLQQWCDSEIERTRKEIDKLEAEQDDLNKKLLQLAKTLPPGRNRDGLERRTTSDQAKVEGKLEQCRCEL